MIKPKQIYSTNTSGNLEILYYHDALKVLIRFIDTGYMRLARSQHIVRGKVFDPYRPRVQKVGYIGIGPYSSSNAPKAYIAWTSMLKRCYSDKSLLHFPTYKGCAVVKEWHNFQSFASWYTKQKLYSEDNVHLDKDLLIKGNKIYSPNTCSLVKAEDNLKALKNVNQRSQYLCRLENLETGQIVEFTNQKEFCRQNSLEPSSLNKLILGKIKRHKNWIIKV